MRQYKYYDHDLYNEAYCRLGWRLNTKILSSKLLVIRCDMENVADRMSTPQCSTCSTRSMIQDKSSNSKNTGN